MLECFGIPSFPCVTGLIFDILQTDAADVWNRLTDDFDRLPYSRGLDVTIGYPVLSGVLK